MDYHLLSKSLLQTSTRPANRPFLRCASHPAMVTRNIWITLLSLPHAHHTPCKMKTKDAGRFLHVANWHEFFTAACYLRADWGWQSDPHHKVSTKGAVFSIPISAVWRRHPPNSCPSHSSLEGYLRSLSTCLASLQATRAVRCSMER